MIKVKQFKVKTYSKKSGTLFPLSLNKKFK